MHAYQLIVIAVMVALGLVVHSTVRLNGLRKELEIQRTMVNVRDWSVLKNPTDYDPREVRLVRTHWIACAAAFGLLLLLFATAPPDLLQRL